MDILKYILVLAVMIGGLFAISFYVSKNQKKKGMFNKNKRIKILEKMSIGNKSSLIIVEVVGKKLLIAENANSITKIDEIKDDLFNEFESKNSYDAAHKINFKEIINNLGFKSARK